MTSTIFLRHPHSPFSLPVFITPHRSADIGLTCTRDLGVYLEEVSYGRDDSGDGRVRVSEDGYRDCIGSNGGRSAGDKKPAAGRGQALQVQKEDEDEDEEYFPSGPVCSVLPSGGWDTDGTAIAMESGGKNIGREQEHLLLDVRACACGDRWAIRPAQPTVSVCDPYRQLCFDGSVPVSAKVRAMKCYWCSLKPVLCSYVYSLQEIGVSP